jgi:hypothetical protein
MNYSVNLSTPLVLKLIDLGEHAEHLGCLSEAQKWALRYLAIELRARLRDMRWEVER